MTVMTPERWQKIIDLADAATELGTQERTSFLDRACASDDSMRDEVESLLASDEQANSFIEDTVFGIAAELIAGDLDESMIGREVGPFRVVGSLGVGGMGEVYLAEDTRLGRKAALKFLPAHFMNDKASVRRFEREARAASALNHPNIITVYEVGQSHSRHFMASEFVEGATLRQHFKAGPMTVAQVLDVAIQVASALAAAHEAGVVHRDIKPENMMLRPDGLIKVLDFGLAKVSDPHPDSLESTGALEPEGSTQTGAVMGTPHYMSPEQARGLKVDGRTDIFSLGVVVYEMLTGRRPFEGETNSHVVVAILERDPPPVTEISPDLPRDLDEIVSKALCKDRLARYQTAADLIADLKSVKQRVQLEGESASDLRNRRPAIAAGELSQDERVMDLVGPGGGTSVKRKVLGGKHVIGEVRHYWRSTALGLLAIAAAAASIIYFSSFEKRKAIDSVAILPFTSASTDSDVGYLADGIADHLTNSLSRLPGVTVISNRAASRYKVADPLAAGQDVWAIGRELNVQTVVAGSIIQRGDRIYVNAELIDARNNRHLWGQHYDRNPADIFGIQEEICNGTSETLRAGLIRQKPDLAAKRHTESTEAYQAYLRGRHFWNQRTEEGLRKAISFFDQALGIDPNYGLAYAGLADSYQLLAFHGGLSPKDYFPN